MLYWAEGGKTGTAVKFTNTDPKMIKLFYDFLLNELVVVKHKIRVSFVYHGVSSDPGNFDPSQITDFWSSLLAVPASEIKPYLNRDTRTTGKKSNRHRFGICCLYFSDVLTQKRIFGAIEGYRSQLEGKTRQETGA